MTAKRQLELGAFMRPISIHTGAWRYPGAQPDANFNLEHIKRLAQTLERGRFSAFFMADHLAVLNMPVKALRRSHTVTSFEPFTLLSYLAGATDASASWRRRRPRSTCLTTSLAASPRSTTSAAVARAGTSSPRRTPMPR